MHQPPQHHPSIGAAIMVPVGLSHDVIKIEDSPTPPPSEIAAPPTPPPEPLAADPTLAPAPVDPKDPEGFLKRCSGHNKKTRIRCGQAIGRNSQQVKTVRPTFLPTCKSHRDQQSFAGWCQFMHPDGERCDRLFRWTPPHFQLCAEHQGHPDTPCYFQRLPLELREEIFRHLLPTGSIGSSTAAQHQEDALGDPLARLDPRNGVHFPSVPLSHPRLPPFVAHRQPTRLPGRRACLHVPPRPPPTPRTAFPMPLLSLLLVSHQFCDDVKNLLFSTITFTIDIRKDGTFMCGRQLLEPRRADGASHAPNGADSEGMKFINAFDFRAVKHYNVDILVEDWSGLHTGPYRQNFWDVEVEIYDIRDYVSVVVSGVLAQARNLCKLNVRLGLCNLVWTSELMLENAKCLIGPFERLRNVRQPRFCGVYAFHGMSNYVINVNHVPSGKTLDDRVTLCSVPSLHTNVILLGYGEANFDTYKEKWQGRLSRTANTSLCKKSPIRGMFTEFKQFYTKLAEIVPEVAARQGRHAFLHRARVAREQENVEAFRYMRNELIHYWQEYLEQEELKKEDMNLRLSRMLDSDVYPSFEPEAPTRRGSDSSPDADAAIILDPDKLLEDGIPMQGNRKRIPGWKMRRAKARASSNSRSVCPRLQHAAAGALTQFLNQAKTSRMLNAGIQQGQDQSRPAFRPSISQPQSVMMPAMPPQATSSVAGTLAGASHVPQSHQRSQLGSTSALLTNQSSFLVSTPQSLTYDVPPSLPPPLEPQQDPDTAALPLEFAWWQNDTCNQFPGTLNITDTITDTSTSTSTNTQCEGSASRKRLLPIDIELNDLDPSQKGPSEYHDAVQKMTKRLREDVDHKDGDDECIYIPHDFDADLAAAHECSYAQQQQQRRRQQQQQQQQQQHRDDDPDIGIVNMWDGKGKGKQRVVDPEILLLE